MGVSGGRTHNGAVDQLPRQLPYEGLKSSRQIQWIATIKRVQAAISRTAGASAHAQPLEVGEEVLDLGGGERDRRHVLMRPGEEPTQVLGGLAPVLGDGVERGRVARKLRRAGEVAGGAPVIDALPRHSIRPLRPIL